MKSKSSRLGDPTFTIGSLATSLGKLKGKPEGDEIRVRKSPRSNQDVAEDHANDQSMS
jgi:hypothetical protein